MYNLEDLEKNNAYLAIFSAGLFIGAATAYLFIKFRQQTNEKSAPYEKANSVVEEFETEDPNNEYRLIMGVRNDLKMAKGKVAAQCGHAAVEAYTKAVKKRPQTLKRWLRYGCAKIAVRVDSEKQLLELHRKAKEMNVLSNIIQDAGHTQVAPGSRTVIAIGPAPKCILDEITGHLKLY